MQYGGRIRALPAVYYYDLVRLDQLNEAIEALEGGQVAPIPGGAGTIYDIVHGLNTEFPIVQIYEIESLKIAGGVDIEYLDSNTVRITFSTAPEPNQYMVVCRRSLTTVSGIGDGVNTDYTIETGLNSAYWLFSIRRANGSKKEISPEVRRESATEATFIFNTIPEEDEYLVSFLPAAASEVIGGGTSEYTIEHGLSNPICQVFENGGAGRFVPADVVHESSGAVTVRFSYSPGAGAFIALFADVEDKTFERAYLLNGSNAGELSPDVPHGSPLVDFYFKNSYTIETATAEIFSASRFDLGDYHGFESYLTIEDTFSVWKSSLDIYLDSPKLRLSNTIEFDDITGTKILFYSHSYGIDIAPYTLKIYSDRWFEFGSDENPDSMMLQGDNGDLHLEGNLYVHGLIDNSTSLDDSYISIITSPVVDKFPLMTAGGELNTSSYGPTSFAEDDHDHDSDYSDINHNHDSDYIEEISSANAGNFPVMEAGGNLATSGYGPGDFASDGHDHDGDYSPLGHNHDSDYIEEITSPNAGNFPTMEAGGNLSSSGYGPSSFATSGHNHDSDYPDISHNHNDDYIEEITSPSAGDFPVMEAGGNLATSTYGPSDFAASGHNHDSTYLKLSGGTLSGTLNGGGNNFSNVGIIQSLGLVGVSGGVRLGDDLNAQTHSMYDVETITMYGATGGEPSNGWINAQGYETNGADFGEYFLCDQLNPVTGTIVSNDPFSDLGIRIAQSENDFLVGVVVDGKEGIYCDTRTKVRGGIPIGMIGKMQTRCMGIVGRGDYLGVYNGLVYTKAKAGRVVGVALEDSGFDGYVLILFQPQTFAFLN